MFKDMNKIAVHSVPRSGSTWLGQIFNSSPQVVYRYQPLFSYAFKGRLHPESTKSEIERFFQDIAFSDDGFIAQRQDVELGRVPTFEKQDPAFVVYKEVRYHHIVENLLTATDDVCVVGLVRNPLSVINSWLRAPREFRRDLGWIEMDEWKLAAKKNAGKAEEYNGYVKWKEATELFLRLSAQYPDRFRLMEYQHLSADPAGQTRSLFSWLGIPLEEQTTRFLEESTSRQVEDAYAVYREAASDDRWVDELDPRIANEIIEDLKGTPLERFLDGQPDRSRSAAAWGSQG